VSPIEKLKGEQLSAVTFVQDYLQLHFDGPLLNVYSPLTISSGENKETSWSPNFRNALCAQIAKQVTQVELAETYLRLTFSDQSSVSISLAENDYTGPEAVYFNGYNETVVI
tara:strand:+ start:820 stop:1155 length:336 start_codon:yes stop_codon:yes gene_type:complete